jgi:hypothetical protein
MNPEKLLIALLFGACAVEAAGRLLGFHERDRISDQREAARRRREWRGDFGLAARQHEVARVRGNWVGVWAFGVALVALAAVGLVIRLAL